MSLVKRPATSSRGAENFIAGAPDAAAPTNEKPRKRIMQGTKEQISVTFPGNRVDAIIRVADRMGLSRAGFINLAVSKLLEENGES